MKKILACILVLMISLSLFASSDAGQKIYSVDSEIYEDIKILSVVTGHALPSGTGPWSGNELSVMLNRINEEEVPSEMKGLYESAKSALSLSASEEVIKLDLSGRINLDLHFHTNNEGLAKVNSLGNTEHLFQDNRFLSFSYEKERPFVLLEAGIQATENFYGYISLDLRNNKNITDSKEDAIGSSKIESNIFLLRNFKPNVNLIDFGFPSRSYGSFGGKWWNVQVGRDKLSWGNGTTGNMAISNNMPFQNFAKFSIFSSKYKYTLLTSFFAHPMNYYGANGVWNAEAYSDENMKGLRMYIAHRFEMRLFSDKLALTITDGLMYMSESGTINFDSLNPFHFNHNNFIPLDSNSTLIFEADYTPFKGFNIYGQFILDDFASPTEGKPTTEEDGKPNSMGGLLGVNYFTPLLKGTLTTNLEVAYTSPYLYLRYGTSEGNSEKDYGLDYVVALRRWHLDGSKKHYDEYCLGYTYGPDALVINLNAGWKGLDNKLKLEANAFLMLHGTHDLWTRWHAIGGSGTTQEMIDADLKPLSGQHITTNVKYPDAKNRNKIETTFDFGLSGSYQISKHFSAMAQLDLVVVNNYGNIENKPQTDFQVVLGGTYSF